MSRRNRIPGYLLHKPTGQARVRLDGKDHWLGRYGSPESRRLYDQLIAEWLSTAEVNLPELTVSQLCASFWRYAKVRYGNSGRGKYGAAISWRPVLRMMRKLYGEQLASKFGPKALKSVRSQMITAGWSRGYINDQVTRGKRIFKWAVEEELLPVETHRRLATVEGLRKGQSDAREADQVEPVDDAIVDATLPHVRQVVADMIRFQRLTGCRPGEVCMLRPCDVDRSGEIWTYVPERHKTEHHGKNRVIFIGPKAQEILAPRLLRLPELWCFPSKPGRRYTTDSYRRAIHRGCEKAKVQKCVIDRVRTGRT